MPATSVITIPEPRLERAGPDLWRLVATVAGTEVFFESRLPLSPRPEVLVCPFLMPVMSLHANLDVAGRLDAALLENLDFVRRRAHEWWPALSEGGVRAAVGAAPPPGPDAGVFYTGGIDSAYVLQQLHPRLRYAVFVEGFDIPLSDEDRLRRARASLGATAAACGVEFVTIRTNLRDHPVFKLVRWGTNHIGALAAMAHALGSHVHTMYVAASDVPPPWGSAPDLDAAWSSGSVKLENFSAELSRLERVASVAKWDRLHGRLRVCLAIKTRELNCGMCEKCIRTRMQLLVSGSPDGLASFETAPSLRTAIGSLYDVHPEVEGQWREIVAGLKDRRLLKQVERALSGRRQPLWRRGLRQLGILAARGLRADERRAAPARYSPRNDGRSRHRRLRVSRLSRSGRLGGVSRDRPRRPRRSD